MRETQARSHRSTMTRMLWILVRKNQVQHQVTMRRQQVVQVQKELLTRDAAGGGRRARLNRCLCGSVNVYALCCANASSSESRS